LGAVVNKNPFTKKLILILNFNNVCYHAVQNLLSSSLLPKNLKIKICKTIILPLVLCGCVTWSFTLREESRLKLLRKGADGNIWT
jgi:hypothetical protein